jgi:hypothetical protein
MTEDEIRAGWLCSKEFGKLGRDEVDTNDDTRAAWDGLIGRNIPEDYWLGYRTGYQVCAVESRRDLNEAHNLLNLCALGLEAAIENAKANGDNSFLGYCTTLDRIRFFLRNIGDETKASKEEGIYD